MSSAAEETLGWEALDGSQQRVAVEVLRHGPLARSELARRLGLSPGSLTRLARPLVDGGLLVEGAARPGSRRGDIAAIPGAGTPGGAGRPVLPLDVRPGSLAFAGVKITADTLFTVVTDLRAGVVAQRTTALPSARPGAVVDAVTAAVEELRSGGPEPAGLGVALSGYGTGRTRSSALLGWSDVPLGPLLAASTGLPTTVENDVRALTAAEHWFGAGRGVASFALVTIGTGVGAGLVVNDRIVTGAHGLGGALGHHRVGSDGLCPDGHRGCAHGLLSTAAITGRVAAALGRPVDHAGVLELARDGDPVAHRVVTEAGRALGTLVGDVAILDPELVVLSGDGIGLVDLVRPEVDAAAAERAGRPVPIAVRPFPFTDWARGAAAVAIRAHVLGAG